MINNTSCGTLGFPAISSQDFIEHFGPIMVFKLINQSLQLQKQLDKQEPNFVVYCYLLLCQLPKLFYFLVGANEDHCFLET